MKGHKMKWNMNSEASRANAFGCTIEQLRAHHAKNREVLREMLAKAESGNKKVNGYTAQKLRAMVADADLLVKGGY
jgi:hypothetical protein